jgi:hypothetical protein
MQSMVCCNCCNNCCRPTSTTNDAPPSQSVRVALLVSKQLLKPVNKSSPKKQQLFVEYPILKTLLGGASSMNPKSNKTLELMPLLMIAFKNNPEIAPKKKKEKKTTIDELTKSLGLVPCRLLQNNPEIREKKILGVHLACLLAEQSNTGFVNSETDNRIGGYVTVEQQQQHIWVGAGLEKKGFLFLCCSNYWCFCLFTGGG